ncbi:MAG: NCS2 family permease [Pseudomonadota bacterium]|nr:NCS2 family permease [Pseudomonadota bacterium]
MYDLVNKKFKLKENNTSVKTEIIAGFTTFMTMAYIIFINPQMMAASGMDYGASFVGTCLAASLACIVMGLYANWPVGLAPGMGLNAFFTYTVVIEMGYQWETALGAVFLAGILFFLMSITPIRRWIIESIPHNMKLSMGIGVGLFIGFIGLKNGGLIIDNASTYLSLGDIRKPETLLAAVGFILIAILSIKKIQGAIIIGILTITFIAQLLGLISFNGFLSSPPSITPILLKLDIKAAFDISMIAVISSFLFVNLFDTTGTLLGVADRAKFLENGTYKNMDRALKSDSSASAICTLFGCSPVTSYIESSSGVEVGGRTGLTAVVVGVLFLLAIFFSPIAGAVPIYATSGALIYVALLMLGGMEYLEWSKPTEIIPALVTIIMIPLTFSIANGIALGFLTYFFIKLFAGEAKDISAGAYFLTIIFLSKFIFL